MLPKISFLLLLWRLFYFLFFHVLYHASLIHRYEGSLSGFTILHRLPKTLKILASLTQYLLCWAHSQIIWLSIKTHTFRPQRYVIYFYFAVRLSSQATQ